MRVLLITLLMLLPLVAFAQDEASEPAEDTEQVEEQPADTGDEATVEDDEEAEEVEEVEYATYEALPFGFRLDVPLGGTLLTPTTEGWSEDDRTALIWHGKPFHPIALVTARVDEVDAASGPITEAKFTAFCDVMVSNWEDSPVTYKLFTRNKLIKGAKHTWNLIEVRQKVSQDKGGEFVYYTVFSTYVRDSIYTVTLYYFTEPNDEVQEFGGPIIASFGLL